MTTTNGVPRNPPPGTEAVWSATSTTVLLVFGTMIIALVAATFAIFIPEARYVTWGALVMQVVFIVIGLVRGRRNP